MSKIQTDVIYDDVWLKCICTQCQKKMKGKLLEEYPSTIYVKDLEEEE